MGLNEYGVVSLIRAQGCYRRLSIVGKPKVVFSSSDDMIQSTKTIVLLSRGLDELTLSDKNKILESFGVYDDPNKVIWAYARELSQVKDPYFPRDIWKYLPMQGFSYLDKNVEICRRIDFTKDRFEIEYLIGGTDTITRERIEKDHSSDTTFGIIIMILFFVIPLILMLMGVFSK